MNKKMAIILGVIILVLTSIVTPFVLKKIISKESDISQDNQFEKRNNVKVSIENQQNETSSGEVFSNEKVQRESGDECEEQKFTAIKEESAKQESGSTTNENKATSSQGTTNKTTQSAEEKNNVLTNVDEKIIKENAQNIETIEVQKNQEIVEEIEQSNMTILEGAVGILKIDKINLYQKVVNGHSLEILKTDLGHVDETAYYKGNVGILGHNNGNAGYFKRLTELAVDDEIQYITENGTMRYKVSEITEIEDTDWSKLSKTEDNRITLITCVRNVPAKRYCVQAIEI